MELRHLEAFVAVAETGGFTAAAARQHLAQQSLSRLIAQLERELGTRLFDRTTRSVALTRAGAAMLDPARRALAAVAQAVEVVSEPGTSPTELRVDVSSTALETGARVVRALRTAHPGVAVLEVEVGVATGTAMLRRGELDLLVGYVDDAPDGLREDVVRREPLLLGMAPTHRLAARSTVPVGELADEELLLPTPEVAAEWIRFVRGFCRQAGVTVRRWPGVTYGAAAAADVVAGGSCVVPTTAWNRVPDDVAMRPLVDPAPVVTWSMLSDPAAAHLAPYRQTVVDLARRAGWTDDRDGTRAEEDAARADPPR